MVIILTAGCNSTLKVNNQSDPKDFEPVIIPGHGLTGEAFAELVFDVPDDISNEEFDIERANIFGDVFLDTLYVEGDVEIEVDIYLGLESGSADLDDPDLNQFIASVTISGVGQHHPVAITDPRLLRSGLANGAFYVKVVAEIITNPTIPGQAEMGVLRIDDIYFDAWLVRETGGLFPLFYMF
jgi:hypothetical protein